MDVLVEDVSGAGVADAQKQGTHGHCQGFQNGRFAASIVSYDEIEALVQWNGNLLISSKVFQSQLLYNHDVLLLIWLIPPL